MSSTPTRVYLARLVGLPVFDPQGDQVAKVRDVVVALRSDSTNQPRVLGMVAEVFGRTRIFVPMTRVTNIDSGAIRKSSRAETTKKKKKNIAITNVSCRPTTIR